MGKQRCNQELLDKVAKRIRQLRAEKNISQEIFFLDTDIHIARIEVGKVNITISTLQAICDYFEISLVDFLAEMR
jgi:transcriptional regulator with XRE-family HTH domain